jgi:hypothetical protein
VPCGLTHCGAYQLAHGNYVVAAMAALDEDDDDER